MPQLVSLGFLELETGLSARQWLAGLSLAAVAIAVLLLTERAHTAGLSSTGIGVFALLSAAFGGFIAGAMTWHWTEGARTFLERWVFLTLSAVGVTFFVCFILFLFVGFVVASLIWMAIGSLTFGIQFTVATTIWALALLAMKRVPTKGIQPWARPPAKAVIFSILGGIVPFVPVSHRIAEYFGL